MLETPHKTLSRAELIGLVAALMALNSLAIDIMLPALPYMGAAFDIADENSRQFVISTYLLGYGIGELVFGPLSDRIGRRLPLIAGVVLYIAAALAAIASSTFAVVLLCRFLQGIGASSTRVIATAIVRDQFSGKAMAEVMSMSFMLFMAIPILAPGMGMLLLLTGPWEIIFLFMGALGLIVVTWTIIRLPETLPIKRRRALGPGVMLHGFRLVVTNRSAFSYGLAGTFMLASLFGFLNSAQQIYVGIFGLDGPWFPIAFACVAALMGVASFTNSRLVSRFGMRRLSHGAIIVFTVTSGIWLTIAETGFMPFWVFFPLLAIIMSCFGWAAANMNSLSMEPLGEVAGMASSIFGFIQTVGGVIIGSIIGQGFNGTVIPVAAGYFTMGVMALIAALVAENGKLFRLDHHVA